MFWLIFRIIIYISLFGAIWYGGQFYVSQELSQGLHETSPHVIFVDQKISENKDMLREQNGSITYPFATISSAISSATERNISTIIIFPGTYKEIITLPENITLYGDTNEVTLLNESPRLFTLTTNKNTKIINLTISGGDNTVIIPYNTNATFINTTISNAHDFGVLMQKKERIKTLPGEKAAVTYEIFDKSDIEIASMPLVRFSDVTVTKNDNQGMYLRDGRVEIVNSEIIENGEEGIDLHPHMHVIISNTNASNNGESGLETEIYDNIVTITNSTFNNNIKNGVAFLTSMGIGDITLTENTILNNQKFGIRCAVHKNRPKKPRPFFQSTITRENNLIKNNTEANVSEPCFTF